MGKLATAGVGVAATALLGGLVTASTAAANPGTPWRAPTVSSDAIFNNPEGIGAQQDAIVNHIANLIEQTPKGAEISIAMYYWDSDTLADQVIAAERRGVRVHIIVDHKTLKEPAVKKLRGALGGNTRKASWVVACKAHRGCIGTRSLPKGNGKRKYAIAHNKFFLFSRVGNTSRVVVQTSANMNEHNRSNAWNNALTLVGKDLYNGYHRYFGDLKSHRTHGGDSGYYRTTGSGNPKAYFFPRHEGAGAKVYDPGTDTVVSLLDNVKCKADGEATQIKIAMWYLSRDAVMRKLASLAGQGCAVDVVYTEQKLNKKTWNALSRAHVAMNRCKYSAFGRSMWVHSKYMLIDGAYEVGNSGRRLKLVFAGSHNLTLSALRSNDETLLRVASSRIHDQYAANFAAMRSACSSRRVVEFPIAPEDADEADEPIEP